MRDVDEQPDPIELEAVAGGVASACVSQRLGQRFDRYEHSSLLRAARYIDGVLRGDDIEAQRALSRSPMRDLRALAMARHTAEELVQQKGVAASIANGKFRHDFTLLRDILLEAHRTRRIQEKRPWTLSAIEDYWNLMFWRSAGQVARPTDTTAFAELVTA